ncbi:TetR family transcriptional regulator [Gordonia sp. HY285]|uniref:TetR/AcrR family transcriptional regulator n=1 Tax=Gordonia liuliyuniae TaxID=2911517 RepID=UPI001F02F89A|nr:TetR family transcriptional regulator [Gordonia liuliyuniae]MCF8608585.1 TetR family transcriptional regulator [Gordonia liuliyuniae]
MEDILRVAARLGAERELDSVRMADVAAEAGVSLATLYRYYPTKHQLFAALMLEYAADLGPGHAPKQDDPVEAVAEMMTDACRSMLARPLLGRAMIVSVNAVRAESAATRFDLRERILGVAGIDAPTVDDLQLTGIVEQAAYGILSWAVMGELTSDEAEASMRRACRLLLAPWRDAN